MPMITGACVTLVTTVILTFDTRLRPKTKTELICFRSIAASASASFLSSTAIMATIIREVETFLSM